ncbi:uncharacterized protein LOC143635621 [Bidens hawaiensis]|uniref:uncharacterized protein LOC143635621 n=1 Tax=Bidens hawaiensis TaxID=980011 RepID=UPI004049F2CD
MRLRSGSLYRRGVETFREFVIPVGLRGQPYVERLVLVYQNLGNWSTTYYSLPGYIYLAPVLGLLAYNGSDLSASNLPELDFWASEDAITVKFGSIGPIPDGSVVKCAWFDLHGQYDIRFYVNDLLCRFKIGRVEMKMQALVLFNEVIQEDERYVRIAMEIEGFV